MTVFRNLNERVSVKCRLYEGGGRTEGRAHYRVKLARVGFCDACCVRSLSLVAARWFFCQEQPRLRVLVAGEGSRGHLQDMCLTLFTLCLSVYYTWRRADLMARMKGLLAHPFSEAGVGRGGGAVPPDDRLEQRSVDGASSSFSVDGLSSEVIDGELSYSTGDTLVHVQGEDGSSSSDGSSPLGWPLGRRERPSTETSPANSKLKNSDRDTFMWEEKREKRETDLSGRSSSSGGS